MTPFPKVHDLYVMRTVLGMVLLAWAVLVGLDVMIGGLMMEIGDIGKGQYTFGKALTNVLYSVPRRLYQMFPTAAVIGALMALGHLASGSELTALRAVGLSRQRIALSVAAAVTLLTLLMVANGETLGPWGQRQADALKSAAKSNEAILARYSGLWAREGNVFLNAEGGQERVEGDGSWLELRGVHLYEFADDGKLVSIARVATAEHRNGRWRLLGVKRTVFGERSVEQRTVAEEQWDSRLDARLLASNIGTPRYETTAQLRRSIEYRRRNGLDAGQYEQHYWERWFYPLNVLALCLAAIPFAFGTLRSGGLGKRLFIGIVFSIGFWLVQSQSVTLANIYHFDMRIGYLAPIAIMLTISWWLFRRRG